MEATSINWNEVLGMAVSLLKPRYPNLDIETLQTALNNINRQSIEKPLTRKEAMELLNCTEQTLHRYINEGKLRRIVISSRCVRIDPQSIRDLLCTK